MSQVKPIPDGAHTLTAYFCCDDAGNAIEFYKKAFGATEMMRMPGPDGKVMHACITIGDSSLFLSDEFPDMGGKSAKSFGGTPVAMFMWCEDVDKSFKRATDAGCTVVMPLDDMFWGDRFGILADPFGFQWQLATHKEDLTPDEMQKRGAAAMGQQA